MLAFVRNAPLGTRRAWRGLVFTAFVLGVSACTPKEPKVAEEGATGQPPAPGRPALVVVPARAQTLTWPDTLEAHGSIAPWHEAVVGAEIAGLRIAQVRVEVGMTVQRGQVLATLNDEPVRADLALAHAQQAQAKAGVAEAQAALIDAQTNAQRARAVAPGGALSAQQIDQFETQAQTAEARLQAARAQLQSAQAQVRSHQLRLAMTQVRAPDSGLVSGRSAQLGAVVATGQELFRIVRGARLEWRAEVSALELSRVQPQQVVLVRAPSGKVVRGVVRRVGPVLDTQTRHALVYVDFPPGSPVKAGMFAQGAFQIGVRPGLFVPQQAVVVREGFSYVFVLDGDHVVQRKVRTGRQAGERIEILDGFDPQAEIVGQGAGFLNDGDRVARVREATPAAPVSGSAP